MSVKNVYTGPIESDRAVELGSPSLETVPAGSRVFVCAVCAPEISIANTDLPTEHF